MVSRMSVVIPLRTTTKKTIQRDTLKKRCEQIREQTCGWNKGVLYPGALNSASLNEWPVELRREHRKFMWTKCSNYGLCMCA